MDITIRPQKRKTLAFQLTQKGAVVLIPRELDPNSAEVQQFITEALARLPAREPVPEPLEMAEVQRMVAEWSQRVGVGVTRTQIRTMRNKWGSISTAGILTLSDDILTLPLDLAEYVVVHELLHLKFPDHRQGWQVSMGMYLPDWREREKRLASYTVTPSQ